MKNDPKNLLEKYPLERSIPLKEANAFEKVLKKLNESYVIHWTREKGVKSGGLQYYDFKVWCTKRNFAEAYSAIGSQWRKYVLPIYLSRTTNFSTKFKNFKIKK